jgi:hypothetical protein
MPPGKSTMGLMRYTLCALLLLPLPLMVCAGDKPVYRCPGKPVLYTDALSVREAQDKGCTTIEGSPITIISSGTLKSSAGSASGGGNKGPAPQAAPRSDSGDSRVEPSQQRARDADARRILETELRREEESLAQLKKEFNNGEPERNGDEKNYQKYLDRAAELKASLARKEGDVAALKRELGKLQ